MKIQISKTDLLGTFLRYYEFMNPFFKLTKMEQQTLALVMYGYCKHLVKVEDEELAWKLAMDYDAKLINRERLGGVSKNSYANVFTSLRRKNIVVNRKIEKKYMFIPDIRNNQFELTIAFEVRNEERQNNEEVDSQTVSESRNAEV